VPRLTPPVGVGVRAVQFARRLLGVPYRWGGDSPGGGFDCSGFVRYVYAHFGIRLPHSSYADFGLGKTVGRGALRPGDLVFFDGVGHVGMYVGGGRFIHAPHSGTSVQMTRLSEPWYRATYDGARRLVAPPPTPREILRRVRVRMPRLQVF
jgi:peptidoglycan endopeptidase LytE